MKTKHFLMVPITFLLLSISAKAQFGGGDGTEFNPYFIQTATHLNNIKMTDDEGVYLYLDKAFIQLEDIDLGVSPWNDDEGWEPIGTVDHPFAGYYDGNNYSIDNLSINRPLENNIGLFGVMAGANLFDIKLLEVSVVGNDIVGALVGSFLANSRINLYSNQDETFSTGTVDGNSQIGGLIGYSDYGNVYRSHSTCSVNGYSFVGGLVGQLDESNLYADYFLGVVSGNNDNIGGLIGRAYESEISQCFSNCDVEITGSGIHTGGLVGYLYSNSVLLNCYSFGSVDGEGTIGGLAGYNHGSTVSYCYSACTVSGTGGYVGGLIGRSVGDIANSYWDMDVSGQGEPGAGDGRTTAEMTYPYAANTFVDWDFDMKWVEDPDVGFGVYNNGYPYLDWQHNPQQYGFASGSGTEADPYLISHANHLNSVRIHWDSYFVQIADVNLGEAPWNEDAGWVPIGKNITDNFDGHYDGGYFQINNLTIDNTTDYLGLFGYMNTATVSNVRLSNINITGRDRIGGLAGFACESDISNCYVEGSITGIYYVGGLAGEINNLVAIVNCETDVDINGTENAGGLTGQSTSSTIEDCSIMGNVETTGNYAGGLVAYAVSTEISRCKNEGNVTGNSSTGGLIGIQSGSTVNLCFTTGNITGTQHTGGLVGYNWNNSSSISNSYSRSQVSGNSTYLGGFVGNNSSGCSITNCYSTGVVNGITGSQGFIGQGSGTVTNSYWDTETSGDNASTGGGVGRTTTEMKNLASFTDETIEGLTAAWDFPGHLYDDAGGDDYWDIDGTTNNGYPFLSFQKERISWTGASSSNPDESANWSSDHAPSADENILVLSTASNKLLVNRTPALPLFYNSLFIESEGLVEIASGKALTIPGYLHNEGILRVKSDETGTGSLIQNSAGVSALVERYISGGWESWDAGWHVISSPVEAQSLEAFETSGENNDYDFYGWDEPSNVWMNYKDDGFGDWNGSANFNPGQGYMLSYQETQSEMAFIGAMNVNNISLSNISFTADEGNGWHLMGNPFASALYWNDGNWELSNVAGTAKIWNESGKSYTDISASGIIPSAQGFMIQVSEAINTLTIPAAARTHNSQAWYKEGSNISITLVASEIDESSFQESKILINPEASDGFDFEYDSHFLAGYAPQFYSKVNGELLSSNSLNEIDATTLIPFGFVKNQAGNFFIRLTETIPDHTIYLSDLKSSTTQNLSENPVYNFTSQEDDNPDRFLLKFGTVGICETHTNDGLQAFTFGRTLSVSNNLKEKSQILVYNLTGQRVYSSSLSPGTSAQIDLNLPTGWYVVQLVCTRSALVRKVFIQ